jgi:hypothetical protein
MGEGVGCFVRDLSLRACFGITASRGGPAPRVDRPSVRRVLAGRRCEECFVSEPEALAHACEHEIVRRSWGTEAAPCEQLVVPRRGRPARSPHADSPKRHARRGHGATRCRPWGEARASGRAQVDKLLARARRRRASANARNVVGVSAEHSPRNRSPCRSRTEGCGGQVSAAAARRPLDFLPRWEP